MDGQPFAKLIPSLPSIKVAFIMKPSEQMLQLLQQRCESNGPLGFEEYLSLVLYHPELGYYATEGGGPGLEGGDFFTNVSVGPVFGELLAGQFLEIWRSLGCPPEFTLMEQGANDGSLMADVLTAVDRNPDFAACVRPVLLEPLPTLRARQQARLEPWGDRFEWIEYPGERTFTTGVHFSNELIDALPFSLFRFSDGRWKEKAVKVSPEGELRWVERPIAGDLERFVEKIPRLTTEPYETEIRPTISKWMKETTGMFERGVILICDYGYPRLEYYSKARNRGTLLCYQRHQKDDNPLDSPGTKDISAHVDFTAVAEAALAEDWQLLGFTDQHHFLVGAAEQWLREMDGKPMNAAEQRKMRSLQTLLHPESMGTRFHFLAFGKGVAGEMNLSGFRHAHPPRALLGLDDKDG